MPNEELESYIKQAKESGMTDEQIRHQLLDSGWSEEDFMSFLRYNPENTSDEELLSATQLLRSAFSKFKERYRTAFLIMLPPVIVGVLSPLSPYYASYLLTGPSSSAFLASWLFVLRLSSPILGVVALIGLIYLFGKEETKSFGEYFKLGFFNFWSYVWISILANFIVGGGFVLFVVPGMIFSIWFGFAVYALILENRKGMESLLRSKHLVSGKFWKVVWRIFIVLLAILVIGLPFLVVGFLIDRLSFGGLTLILLASLIVTPLAIAYYVLFFQNLVQIKKEPFVYDKKQARKFIIVGFAGIALVIAGLAFGGYYYFTKLRSLLQQSVPISTPTSTPAPTASWQTYRYRNEEYGFEVKYPRERIVQSPSGFCGICKFDVAFLTDAEFNALNVNEVAPFTQESIYVHVYKTPFSHNSLVEWFKDNFGFAPLSVKEFKAGYVSGIKAISPGAYADSEYRSAYFIKDNFVFSIRNISELELDQILSTFRFLE